MTADTPNSDPVATGDRRGDVHLEPDPDQLVRARFTEHATGPLPPEEQSAWSDAGETPSDTPPVEDARVTPDDASAWDARPAEPDDAP